MRNRIKKILSSSLVAILAAVISVAAPLSVMASSVRVSASRDDIYNQLLEASRINVVANTLKKCISHIKSNDSAISADAVKTGSDIFDGGLTGLTNTTITTALWVEDKIQGNGGDDGAIWCKQDGGGQNILQLFASLTGLNIAEDMMCNGGYHRLVQRATLSYASESSLYYTYAEDKNCNSFNDSGVYIRSSDAAEQFKNIYTNWYNSKKSENPYLPTYDELGNFNNVDGYFNYITDFNLKCDADRVTKKNKTSGTDYYKITEYDKTENKVIAQNYYYHVNSNKSWTYSLSSDNTANSCTGLLSRISALQVTGNGIAIANRTGGYENIILADLNDACKDAKTSEGNNGWQELKAKLQEIVDDPDSPEDAVNDAKKNIEEINRIVSSGDYVESSGSEDDEDGKVYQCVNIDGLVINVDSYDTPSTDPGFIDNGDSGTIDACYNGAGVLGWIVCPITSGLAKVGSAAYEWIEENFLQIRSSIFTDDNNGVREAWGTIRNIANVGFIIMLLIVIFSQITGVGIDNYGIKRILPKLIVGAIVMNLSYIICELAVDVSNIVGSGLKNLLSAMGPTLNAPTSSGDASLTQYLVVGGTGVLAAAGIMILSSGGLGAVLTLLIALLSVVISIIVLFVVLIVRQAGVVVCVVIAPIAILMYLLPNTEKFFKRWLDLMKGLLLVYPLCGLVIGAGDFIGKIFGNLAASADSNLQMGFALSAMVVQAVPYLFIPTLLKSSLAAMGNLGAKISGLGNRLRGGTAKRIQGSNAMKDSKERASEFRTRVKAGIDRDGKERKLTGVGKALRGGKRGMARARAQYLKNQDTRNREDSLNGIGFQAAVLGQQKRAEKDELADYMTLINNETRNGEDEEKLYSMFDQYMADGDKSGAVAVARIAGRRKDTAAGFLSKKITGYDSKTGEISDVAKGYNSKMLASVMKEIATGENSGMYRSSTPMGFEFAAQYNREYGKDGATPEAKYSAWRSGSATRTREDGSTYEERNIDRALNNYVTNSQELVGTKNSSLTELNELMASGAMGEGEVARIRQLANETIENRGRTGVWDTTKAENIYKLAGREAEYKAMVDGAAGSVRGENAAAGVNAAGASLDVRAAAGAAGGNVGAGATIDIRGLGDETLLDIATNPNASANDANRVAAEQEYLRRNPGFNSGTGSTGAGANNPQPPQVPPQA